MRIIILGAGIIGVTNAWYLAKSGCQVTVIDRQSEPACEASFANAGQISPTYSTPWAAPGLVWKAIKWLVQPHSPLSIRPDGSLFQWKWIFQMLLNCSEEQYATNKTNMLRLADYSQKCLTQLRLDTSIEYEGLQLGGLQLFRTQEQFENAVRDVELISASGLPCELLFKDKVKLLEPALGNSPIFGALQLPKDETGDCHMFAVNLAEKCKEMGVVFEWEQNIEKLERQGSKITGVWSNKTLKTADHYILSLGCGSREIAEDLGVYLPVYPLKGYSLTLPILDPDMAPRSTVMDETYKVAITRFKNRIRVGGMAEVAGFDLSLNPKRRETLEMVLTDLFPGAADLAGGQFWTGLRPMTPDSTPIVGKAPNINNLWINSGHGTLGWTMACGSGKLVSDLLLGCDTDIDPSGLGPERYTQKR